MRTESDAILVVQLVGDALTRTRLRIVKLEFHLANRQSIPNDQPEWRMPQFVSQRTKDFVASIRAVVLLKLFNCFFLSIVQKSPKMIFGDTVLRIGDFDLLEDGKLVLAN